MEVKCFIQYVWVRQEGVCYNLQFVVVIKMMYCVVNQCLCCIQVGLYFIVEWWVGDDYIKMIFYFGKDVVGKDFIFNIVGCKCCVVGFYCWCRDIV